MTTAAALRAQEVSALIGLLAVVEGAARNGDLPTDLALRLRQRVVGPGVLAGFRRPGDLVDALDDLLQQVRTLEDEAADEVVASGDVPLVNVVAFADEAPARSFVEEMQRLNRDVDDPVHEPAHRRWVVAVHTGHRETGEARVGHEFMAARDRGGWHLGAF